MSLLSQFFPSGGGVKLPINMLTVGGGAGGTPSLPLPPLPIAGCAAPFPAIVNYCCLGVPGGSGGGGGEANNFYSYPVDAGSTITVTIGAGGASSSGGGNTCVCISNQSSIIAKGGLGCANALSCTCFSNTEYAVLGNCSFGGGVGGRSQINVPGYPTLNCNNCACCNILCNIYGGVNFNGVSVFTDCPTNASCARCIYHQIGDGLVVKARSFDGGLSCKYYPYPALPGISGAGGAGGGGATAAGPNGNVGNPGAYTPPAAAITNCCAGPGGSGGAGLRSSILGTCSVYGIGGGGGGGHYRGPTIPAPCVPGIPINQMRGCGGPSPSGGCGGQGGASICSCPNCAGCNATSNTGGGGGGGGGGLCYVNCCLDNVCPGGSGGSGLVVVQYPTAYPAAPASPGATDCSPSTPGFYTYAFAGPGAITLPS